MCLDVSFEGERFNDIYDVLPDPVPLYKVLLQRQIANVPALTSIFYTYVNWTFQPHQKLSEPTSDENGFYAYLDLKSAKAGLELARRHNQIKRNRKIRLVKFTTPKEDIFDIGHSLCYPTRYPQSETLLVARTKSLTLVPRPSLVRLGLASPQTNQNTIVTN